jgi:hypothetical protein
VIVPLCSSLTIRQTMSRPSPVPCPRGFEVKNGSKIRGRMSWGDARAIVHDLDHDVRIVLTRAQDDPAGPVHRVDGVVDDVRPDLVQGVAIHPDLRDGSVVLALDLPVPKAVGGAGPASPPPSTVRPKSSVR